MILKKKNYDSYAVDNLSNIPYIKVALIIGSHVRELRARSIDPILE